MMLWQRWLMQNLIFLGGIALALSLKMPEPVTAADPTASHRVYVGTYTAPAGKADGIYAFDFDSQTGKAGTPELAAKTPNPSFLALNPTEDFLYAVNEVADPIEGESYRTTGWVTAYRIDKQTGALTELNRQPSGGAIACFVCIDRHSKYALVANYSGGSISCLPIKPDGSLAPPSCVINHGANDQEHGKSRGHSINFSPDEQFVIVGDAGLDALFIYRFDHEQGLLIPADPPTVATGAKTAPRHFSFHPNGKWAYNNNERNFKINAFDYDAASGHLKMRQTLSTLPPDVPAEGSTAEVLVHPSGKFAYVSNRGPNSLAIYNIDEQGQLSFRGAASTEGKIPRNFRIDPTGKFLLAANQESGMIVVFQIDPQTGGLTPTGEVVQVPSPVCIKFATAQK